MFKYNNKNNEFKAQLDLLQNDLFSVLILNRTTEKAITLNKFGRTSLSKEEILSFKSVLLNKNTANNDIYIKAEAGSYFNLVVDDLTEENKNKLLEYIFCDLIIESSKNNFQAIINIEKNKFTTNEMNFVVKFLNENFGDPNFSGANHFFRCVSFNNKKAKNNNELVKLVKFTNTQTKERTEKLFKNLIKLEYKKQEDNLKQEIRKEINSCNLSLEKEEKGKELIQKEQNFCIKKFKNLDFSAVDFRIVKRLFKNDFNAQEIATLFLKYNDFANRHANPTDYLNRTINKAILEVRLEQKEKSRKKTEKAV